MPRGSQALCSRSLLQKWLFKHPLGSEVMLLLIIICVSQSCAMIKWDIACVKKKRKKERKSYPWVRWAKVHFDGATWTTNGPVSCSRTCSIVKVCPCTLRRVWTYAVSWNHHHDQVQKRISPCCSGPQCPLKSGVTVVPPSQGSCEDVMSSYL